MIQTASARNAVVIRLEQLAQMYRHDQASEVMERTLTKLFQYKADVCRGQLAQLTQDLAEYEQQYGQPSQAFYAQFQQGRTDDRYGLCRMGVTLPDGATAPTTFASAGDRRKRMTSAEYVNAIKDRLVFEPQIVAFHVIRERMTATDA